MKVTNTRGDWIGLAYWKDCSYRVDHFSSPDEWQFGFEVVYRLIFSTSNLDVIGSFKKCFREAFSLPDKHYDLNQQIMAGSSVYWRVYWGREGFELNLLKKCEAELNRIAEATNSGVTILEMAIIPRSLNHIRMLAGFDK
jgi:hypothetical protein